MRSVLQIGELAALAGVTPKAVRHYHKLGLLPEPERTDAGYRLYTARDLLRVHQIRRLQALGLSLSQVRDLLATEGGAPSLRGVLESLLRDVSAQIAALEQRRARIAALLAAEEPDVLAASEGTPRTFDTLMEKLDGVDLGRLSPELLDQERRLWGLIDSFQWPEGYDDLWRRAAEYYAANPERHARLVGLAERLAALEHADPDAPEVEALARECAALDAADPTPEEVGVPPPWMDGPIGAAMKELMATNFSPAQRRFFELMQAGGQDANPEGQSQEG